MNILDIILTPNLRCGGSVVADCVSEHRVWDNAQHIRRGAPHKYEL